MKYAFSKQIRIGDRLISKKSKTFIIAEIGSNHNQSIKMTKKLIDVAKEAGVDAVKFQSLNYDELYLRGDKNLERLHKKIDLPENMFVKLFDYAKKKGLIFLSCPTYFRSIDILEGLGIVAFKIASPITIGFQSLIFAMALKNKPMIVSTGYCTISEIDRAVKSVVRGGNKKLILLHCSASYPISWAGDVSLGFIKILKKRYGCLVGFSDHTMSTSIPATAVALGAKIIEKHFTLSRKLSGPDHGFALEPKELSEMVRNIRDAEKITGQHKIISSSEKKMKKAVIMKLVAAENIASGAALKKEQLIFRRVQGGIEEYKIDDFIGRRVLKAIKKMSLIRETDFSD